ncbi:MAG: putative rane protein [Chloroflexi bacterium]|jgi:pimeloyl-ACP methyl ester carboxylesterase|nr:putative rane protein [Chloroflexota bacterium]
MAQKISDQPVIVQPRQPEEIEEIDPPSRKHWIVLAVAALMVLFGGSLAWYVQTDGGNITIKDVRFVGTNGTVMSALLYVPKGVTNKAPAPAILAIHGYINSRETQDGFAIEFARRGYVVLALDQTGHGYSDGPAFANGFGGPDGLKYLNSLDIVDKKNIGLEGHSMGGWASLIATGVYSTSYQSIVLEGSSTGTSGAPEGTATFPRNLGLVFSKYDEFSQLMWGSPSAAGIVNTKKLQTLFNTTEPVEVGKVYGSIEQGTARKLYQPAVTHPGDHISTAAIGAAMEWMGLTLKGGKPLATTDQIWYWKEFGTLIALIGMVIFIFPLGALLLRTPFFRSLREPMPERKGLAGWGWWVGALLTVAIPIISFYWFQKWGNSNFPAKDYNFWPQNITTGIMVWAVLNGLISLGLFLIWHFALNRRLTGATFGNYGLTWSGGRHFWSQLGKTALLAIIIISGAYALLAFSDFAFKTDFRFWVVAVKLMSATQFRIFLDYLLPFVAFFLVLGIGLHGQLRLRGNADRRQTLARAMLVNAIMVSIGFVILLLVNYIPLFTGGVQGIPTESLLNIVAFQFVPLMAIVGSISTYFYYKTGHIYLGAFLNGMLITWIIVASTATHVLI